MADSEKQIHQANKPGPKKLHSGNWKKGMSGNTKGRPMLKKSFSEIARGIMDSQSISYTLIDKNGKEKTMSITCKETIRHALACQLTTYALKGNIPAFKELLERTEGKVEDMLRMTNDAPVKVTFEIVSKAPEKIVEGESNVVKPEQQQLTLTGTQEPG